ncbi:MAG: hypothetical protein VYB49_01490, partial [Actinomycetota bacterium]|nr:hypothetical protein [Actinomycetota bacterium]
METDGGTIEVTLAGATKMGGSLVYNHPCPNECPDVSVGDCYRPIQNNPTYEVLGEVTAVTEVNTSDTICIINISNGHTINIPRYGSTAAVFTENDFGDCPSSCSLSGDGGWHYPAPTICDDQEMPAQNNVTNPYPDGFVARDKLIDAGLVGTVKANGGCFTLGTPSEIDECEWEALQDEGVPEGGASDFENFVQDCFCCQQSLDPESGECDQFFDNNCNPIGALETYDSGTTYTAGAEVWAFTGSGYTKYRLIQGTSFNVHPTNPVAVTQCGCSEGDTGCSEVECTTALFTDAGCDSCEFLYDFVGMYAEG